MPVTVTVSGASNYKAETYNVNLISSVADVLLTTLTRVYNVLVLDGTNDITSSLEIDISGGTVILKSSNNLPNLEVRVSGI